MSDDDSLEAALRAMRANVDGTSAKASATRTQILDRARKGRLSRRRTTLVVLPLAAAFAASVAWGAATGRLSRWMISSSAPPAVPAASADAQPGAALAPSAASAPLPSLETVDAGSATESVPPTAPSASGDARVEVPSSGSSLAPPVACGGRVGLERRAGALRDGASRALRSARLGRGAPRLERLSRATSRSRRATTAPSASYDSVAVTKRERRWRRLPEVNSAGTDDTKRPPFSMR
jgi:hypothetical protein